ncbi:uncharacterized protein MYCFIDRAFT_180049 [Pseudocercospora fijiensis CIRAD86]|uniref:Uncharacterized protein n=1 Tax=Pseudocercospora fijiensis (strain CIRAD86) TaxID=383855 RepID=M3AJ07_PSEFD|nr:uncharacterized protein MYCFIDRAFT_180049 [Pseudocercospora fijiensis CIRAD86]EME77173.1 hypothetical protein MYCFIDRAFT_180049 [Pseudocercospora fijiensis CIRAD86]
MKFLEARSSGPGTPNFLMLTYIADAFYTICFRLAVDWIPGHARHQFAHEMVLFTPVTPFAPKQVIVLSTNVITISLSDSSQGADAEREVVVVAVANLLEYFRIYLLYACIDVACSKNASVGSIVGIALHIHTVDVYSLLNTEPVERHDLDSQKTRTSDCPKIKHHNQDLGNTNAGEDIPSRAVLPNTLQEFMLQDQREQSKHTPSWNTVRTSRSAQHSVQYPAMRYEASLLAASGIIGMESNSLAARKQMRLVLPWRFICAVHIIAAVANQAGREAGQMAGQEAGHGAGHKAGCEVSHEAGPGHQVIGQVMGQVVNQIMNQAGYATTINQVMKQVTKQVVSSWDRLCHPHQLGHEAGHEAGGQFIRQAMPSPSTRWPVHKTGDAIPTNQVMKQTGYAIMIAMKQVMEQVVKQAVKQVMKQVIEQAVMNQVMNQEAGHRETGYEAGHAITIKQVMKQSRLKWALQRVLANNELDIVANVRRPTGVIIQLWDLCRTKFWTVSVKTCFAAAALWSLSYLHRFFPDNQARGSDGYPASYTMLGCVPVLPVNTTTTSTSTPTHTTSRRRTFYITARLYEASAHKPRRFCSCHAYNATERSIIIIKSGIIVGSSILIIESGIIIIESGPIIENASSSASYPSDCAGS